MNASSTATSPRLVRRLPVVAALLVFVLATVLAPRPAAGSFARARTATATISSATLQPVSDLTATTGCDSLLSLKAKATLSWTATPSTFAAGYRVERWRDGVLESAQTLVGSATTTTVDAGLATGTTYTWKVHSYSPSWTSTTVPVSATTPLLCA